MKQKILFMCFILLSGVFNQIYAQTIEVKSLSEFSTENPPTSIYVELLQPLQLDSNTSLQAGAKIKGNLVDVVSPKRLKRNADFSFEPVYYWDEKGNPHPIEKEVKASYTVPIDKAGLAKTAVTSVGSFFVKGLSIGVAAVEGAVKNEQDNRLKSSAVSVYESSPVSYVEKGQEIEISVNQNFFLKFPNIKDQDENVGQNYTYQIEKE